MFDLEVIGQGHASKIYRDGDTAIKLYVDVPSDWAKDEFDRQKFSIDAGLPVPAVFGVRGISQNATALDMAYIDGRPIMRPGMSKEERDNAIRTMVGLQRTVHGVCAAGQPKQAERLAWRIEHTLHLDANVKARLVGLLARLDNGGDRLCHGDFHPLNILYDGQKHWIIDWVDATAGSPLADACRTYLIFRQFLARASGIYLRMFCEDAGVKKEGVLAWLPVIAAVRMDEGMDERQKAGLLAMATAF